MWQKLILIFYSMVLVLVCGLNENLQKQSVLYGLSSLVQNTENTALCHQQLKTLFKSIDEQRAWALKVLDASGGPIPGFFYGNNLWLGSHTQCSDLTNRKKFEINYEKVRHADPTPFDYPPYPLGFVMAHVVHNSTLQEHSQLPLEFTIQLGLCVPKSCSSKELYPLLSTYLDNKYLIIQNLYNLNLNLTFIQELEDDGSWMFQLPKVLTLIIVTTIVLLLSIIGTIYDVRQHNRAKNLVTGHNAKVTSKQTSMSEVELVSNNILSENRMGTFGKILKSFSIYSNVKNLVKTKLTGDSVAIIHGLRFFGMLWVIMVHAVFYQTDYMENALFGYRLSEDLFSQILSNSTFCVDTYLFLSGFLLSYLFFKSKSKKNSEDQQKSTNYLRAFTEFIMMCLNRFLRLTPPYMIALLFTDVMYTFYRKSSALQSSEQADIVCSKYWWRNLLYINNLYPRSEMCMSWSWYLSIDTQFFTVSAFLLVLSTFAFKTSVTIIITLIIGNIVSTTYKSYSIGYIPTMDEQLAQLDAIYDLPWNRIGPYLIGVITAYILLIKLQKTLILKERTRIFLWTLFPLLNLWILFGIYKRQISVEFSAVYMGISRTLWGIGLGWLMVACCSGNARALEKFLSFRGWIPLSRLTYCAYLLNPLVANMIYMGSESSYRASLAGFAVTILGITMISFYIAFVFSMLFESPFILLTKMAMSTFIKHKPKKTTNESVA